MKYAILLILVCVGAFADQRPAVLVGKDNYGAKEAALVIGWNIDIANAEKIIKETMKANAEYKTEVRVNIGGKIVDMTFAEFKRRIFGTPGNCTVTAVKCAASTSLAEQK